MPDVNNDIIAFVERRRFSTILADPPGSSSTEPERSRPSNAASYIGPWIKVPKDDKRAIFNAASHAQRAADFLHGLQQPASKATAAMAADAA